MIGEKIAKGYRDRYANFSKGAHFEFGKMGEYQSYRVVNLTFLRFRATKGLSDTVGIHLHQ